MENAKCYVTVDDAGRLVENKIEVNIFGSDRFNERHTMQIAMDLHISDYGATVPDQKDESQLDKRKVRVTRQSTQYQDRLEEIDKFLADDDLEDDVRDAYEAEKKHLLTVIENEAAPAAAASMAVIGGADSSTEIDINSAG